MFNPCSKHWKFLTIYFSSLFAEFIDVGKPNRALEVLYEVIKRGKMRNTFSEKLLEPIMFKYLELCVDLKKSHLAKEGLYQYRNIFQSVSTRRHLTVGEKRFSLWHVSVTN